MDGENPDADTCANIAQVELAMINQPEDQFWSEDDLILDCNPPKGEDGGNEEGGNGGYIGADGGVYLDSLEKPFDRCGGEGEVLRDQAEPYKYRWRAITDLNFIVDCSPILEAPIESIDGGTQLLLQLPPVNFVVRDGGVVCPDGG